MATADLCSSHEGRSRKRDKGKHKMEVEQSRGGQGKRPRFDLNRDLRGGSSSDGAESTSRTTAKSQGRAERSLRKEFPKVAKHLREHGEASGAPRGAGQLGTAEQPLCLSDSEDGDGDAEAESGARKEQELYEEHCMDFLRGKFPRARVPDLRDALAGHGGRLTPAYWALLAEYQRAIAIENPEPETGRVSWLPNGRLNLLKKPRVITQSVVAKECPRFQKEWASLEDELAQSLGQIGNEEGSHSGSNVIDCGCCCADYPFEEMVQCADGHLFCFGCLRRRVEESIFGGIKACGSLPCMDTSGCQESFPLSELNRALPGDLLIKYEQRQAEDSVARAKIERLVYCPSCNLAVEVEADMKVLSCPNTQCKKSSCLLCKEPDHLPLRCEEVEKVTETSHRRRIEEAMSKAIIRVCTSCKAELVKADGCNKVVCRCGQAMCYLCRTTIKDYDHFCQHARMQPNEPCRTCTKCGLWEEEKVDEVLKTVKDAAIQEVAKDEPNILNREIGPKVEVQRNPPHQGHQGRRDRALEWLAAAGGDQHLPGNPGPWAIPNGNPGPWAIPNGNPVPWVIPNGNPVPWAIPNGNPVPWAIPNGNPVPWAIHNYPGFFYDDFLEDW